jgi:hypothetical protein
MLEISKGKRPAPGRSEEDEPEEDEPRLAGAHRVLSSLKLWITLAVVAAGCGLAGSKEPWALGIVAALIALSVAVAPPRSAVPRMIWWPLVLFALLSLGSFLPLSEAAMPWWRKTFAQDFGVNLGGLRSPQPWVSLETWIAIAIGLIWLWHCLGRGFRKSERRWMVQMLALLVTAFAVLAVWVKRAEITVPFWRRMEWGELTYFGPFPNRNNFGGLLAMGAVLTFAATYDSYRRRSRWWPFYALTLAPIVLALVSNTSRAGLGLFFLGLIAWVAFASFSRRSAQRMGSAAAVLLALVAVVILFGQHILQRMSLAGFQDPIAGSTRLHLWSDCFAMIAKTPVLGIGLGCFDAVFPFHQTFFSTRARNIHPESDWSWITVEVGVPAVLLLIVALVSYARLTGLWRGYTGKKNREDHRLRNACAVAALILPVHAFVDTPAHQPGLFCLAALLAGLSLRERRPARNDLAQQVGKLRLLFFGFCCLASASWFAIAAGIPVLPGTSSSKLLGQEAERLIDKGDLAGAKTVMNRAIAMRPMHYDNYFERGALSLARGLPPKAALEDFARQRYLEPHLARICHSEALVWLQYYPAYAPAAWREAMRRDVSQADEFYVSAFLSLREHPEIRPAVRGLAMTARQKLDYIVSCGPKDFTEAVADLLEAQPTLENFSPDERLRLFDTWFAVGDRSQLIARLENDANWRSSGWPVLAKCRAAQGDYLGAYRLALEYLPPPAAGSGSRSSDLAQLRRDFLFHPTDFNYGFALFEAESAKGLISDALDTLDKVAQLPNAPSRVLYEQAVLLSRKGDYAAAWEKMKAYIEKWQVDRRDSPASVNRSDETAIKSDVTKLLKKSGKKP